MAKQTKRGRVSIFGPKNVRAGGGRRVQGYLGKVAAEYFADAAQKLSVIADVSQNDLSDADIIEFLARGRTNTRLKLRGKVQ